MKKLIEEIFALSPKVRYVAVYNKGELTMCSSQKLENASTSETDRLEELLVNPTLLTLVKQRGEIDCGGAHFLLVRYGSFYQFVKPIDSGHISVAIELSADLLTLVNEIEKVISALNLESF